MAGIKGLGARGSEHGLPIRGRPNRLPRARVLGVDLAVADYAEVMDAMDAMIERGERGYVCAMAVHGVMAAHREAETRAAVRGATLNLPDGMPLVWAINLLGQRLADRVYGPELMHRYCRRCAELGHRVWLYGGRDEVSLARLADRMRDRYPGIAIVGGHAPPFRPLTAAEDRAVAEQINGDRPDVVWVGIGEPKQEKWMGRMRGSLEAPVLVGVGAAFDFIAGHVAQAPPWMQRRGLEWAFRLSQEPRRLLPRYLSTNPQFVLAFARQYARERLGARLRNRELGYPGPGSRSGGR